MVILGSASSLIAAARKVREASGKPVRAQLREIVAAKLRNPTLGATDYYSFRMYDDAVREVSDPRDFLGWRAEGPLAHALNPRSCVLPGWDKLTFYLLAADRQLPIPGLAAVYRPGSEPSALARVTTATRAQLAAFLRSNHEWPLFAKPSYSQRGVGSKLLLGYLPDEDVLLCAADEKVGVERFVDSATDTPAKGFVRPEMGFLFQEVIKPHDEIARVTGTGTVSGLRIVLVRLDDRVEIVKALWKIVTGANHVDNYQGGSLGNFVAEIDVRTGVAGRAMLGVWPHAKFVDVVPASGCRIPGYKIPEWAALCDLCRHASNVAPMMRIQHWDIAISERGPILLELNDHGGIRWLQVLGQGLLRTSVREALARHCDRRKYPWVRRLVPT